MNVRCDFSSAVKCSDGREQRQNFQVFHPLWQLHSDVVWESFTASCWHLHHYYSNWCRCSRFWLTRPKQTDPISLLGWSVLKLAFENQMGFTCSAENQKGLLDLIQIFQAAFLSCSEYGKGRKRKLYYENHLLINTQSYWIQPLHNQRNNGHYQMRPSYCNVAVQCDYHSTF